MKKKPTSNSASTSLPTSVIRNEIHVDVNVNFDPGDDISCISDGGSIGTSQSSLNLSRYFGVNARNEFGRRIKWLSNQRKLLYNQRDELIEKTRFESSYAHDEKHSFVADDNENDSVDSFDVPTVKDDIQDGTATSPRTKYIAACLKKNMNPRMSLILRKRVSADLNLQHQGMGDTLGVLFAESLKELPYVHSINIADNNLTDVSIGPILRSIISLSNVTSLNISNNMIDSKSTRALAEYLRSKNCPIKKLILQKSDIDDGECHMFVEALKENSSLLELDLSNNKIGQAETLNTVQPDYITGGEALADMLASNSCRLQYLNLAWNLIRLDGGVALAGCVATNKYVTYLDLSYNALGKDGGEVLGSALLDNTVLQTLLLTNNNINFSACFSICVALEENFSLRKLSLDGNPIGEGGGRALMQVPFTAGSRVKVTASGCNLLIKDMNPLFNYSQPNDFYVLHLKNPYHRAVCIKLLRLLANHQTYVFLRFAYSPEPKVGTHKSGSSKTENGKTQGKSSSSGKSKKATESLLGQYKDREDYYIPPTAHEIKLIREYSAEKEERLDQFQLETLANLRVIQAAATDINLAREMFRKYDSDGSGAMDRYELKELLQKVGLHLENEVFEQAMDMCDIDGSGELDEDEFLDFIRYQKDEAAARIKDLTEYPVMVYQDNPTIKYVPPYEGTLYALVGDSFNHKGSRKIVTAVDHSNMMDVIRKGVDNMVTVLEFCIQTTFLRQKEAIQIFNAMHLEIKDPAVVVSKILPRMADPIEARSLMMQVINFDKVALRRLMTILGNAFNPLLGIYDGYYSLDMSNEMDRICMSKLLVQSQLHKDQCMDKCLFHNRRTKDVSQKGDWSAFRNEVIDGELSHISVDLFNPIPVKGKVSFDFSGSAKAPREAAVIKDTRCVNVLVNLCLVPREQRDSLLNELQSMQIATKSSIQFDGRYKSFMTTAKAEECQLAMTKFYSRLLKRTGQYRKALRSEIIRHSSDQNTASIPVVEEESDSDDSVDSASHVVYENNEQADAERQNEIDLALLELGTLPSSKKDKFLKSESLVTPLRRGAFFRSGAETMASQENIKESSFSENKETKKNDEIESDESDFEFQLEDDEDEDEDDGKKNKLIPTATATSTSSSSSPALTAEALSALPSNNTSQEKKKVKKFFNLTRSSAYIADYSSLMRRKQDPLFNANIKASRIVLAIVDILSRVYIKARHLALILKWFPLGRTHRTRYFGTYRVELAVLLYNRVVDIHNLDLVGAVLTVYEWACFICRIGILNIFNPLKPEGPICLDMSRRDERKVAEILTALSVIEPGENWLEASFRWSYDAVTIPGWELTQSWLAADTVPDKGVVFVIYYSGEGQRIRGCVADIPARKSLLALVRIEEADIIHDEDNILEDGSRIHAKAVGLHFAQTHMGLWDTLLATANSTSARLGAGEAFSSVFPNCSYIRSRMGKSDNEGNGNSSPEKMKRMTSVGDSPKKPPATPPSPLPSTPSKKSMKK